MIRLLTIAFKGIVRAWCVIDEAVTDDRRFDYDAHYGREPRKGKPC